ncbi:RGG repeats nuclear RNA binding protein A-like isoform X2 [Rutidosis leptorrhynchoides]|uniref:RGG repeats nuclear RNA binding protein A-like isoform X2 n=1 Tax=Rutidosis leptorrhynchoides TaxID=125765 RepID=UPI003A98D891
MASMNPFNLLAGDDNDDPSQLIAKLPAISAAAAAAPATKKASAGGLTKPAAKLPSKPLPPAQAVQEAKGDGRMGGSHFGGRGASRGGRGGRGFNRDFANNENTNGTYNGFNGGNRPSEDDEFDRSSRREFNGSRGGYRGPRRGGYSNGDEENERPPRRVFERHSGTGRGNEIKREGAGRGNWGTATDEVALEPEELVVDGEKNAESETPAGQKDGVDNKANPESQTEDKEPEEMTLEEYEKVLEEKRKALMALKSEERTVKLDKDLAKMQLLSNKKSEEDIFVKLGSDKDKRKEAADKEEKSKKSLSINEFLKPADGEKYRGSGGRGRDRGRGPRGGYGGGNRINDVAAPAIEDVGQFPSLKVK